MKNKEKIIIKIAGIIGLAINILLLPFYIIIMLKHDTGTISLIIDIANTVFTIFIIAMTLTKIALKRIFMGFMGSVMIRSRFEILFVAIFWIGVLLFSGSNVYNFYHPDNYMIGFNLIILLSSSIYYQRILINKDYILWGTAIYKTQSVKSYQRKDDAAISKKNGYLEITFKNGKTAVYMNSRGNLDKLCGILDTYMNQNNKTEAGNESCI